jgi:DNA invertase Pin-like site-specific DNA recombinase
VRAALYLRVSSQGQHTENQEIVLEQWAKQRGWEIVATYAEEDSAWKAGHQRALHQLLVDAQKRKFQLILVWALDRLSRSGALAISSLVHKLGTYGVRVFSYQESWTEMPGELADVLFALTGWVANMESKTQLLQFGFRFSYGAFRLQARICPAGIVM